MDKLSLIKGIASLVTGAGVGKTVDLILKNNLPVEMNWKARLATFVGSAAISGYISAKCSEHVEEEIDNVAEMVGVVKKTVDKNKDIVINSQEGDPLADYHPSEIMEVFPDVNVEMTD